MRKSRSPVIYYTIIVSSFAITFVICLILLTQSSLVFADPITNDLIKEKESQVDNAKNQLDAIKNSRDEIKKLIGSLNLQKDRLSDVIEELDAALDTLFSEISELEGDIAASEEEITRTQAELEEAASVEQAQYSSMKVRIKCIYENNASYLIEFILSGESFAEIMNKTDYVAQVSAYDRKMLESYRETKAYIASCEEALRAQRELLLVSKENLENERAELEELIVVKNKQIAAFENSIENQEETIEVLEQEAAAQEEEIRLLEEAIKQERRRLIESNLKPLKYDGGKFKWPAPEYTRISDDYGTRIHPTLGIEQFHNGVDMAAPGGSPILCAYDGRVVEAAYSSTMGNYVMVDHGDSLATIYMHASALLVKKGDVVLKGQEIAKVGTTGRSTGNHLHFSVRNDGQYVNPWNYFAQN